MILDFQINYIVYCWVMTYILQILINRLNYLKFKKRTFLSPC